MPPKNMISVLRNSHMPKEAACCCCPISRKWCRSSGLCCSMAAGLSLNRHLLRGWNIGVVVSLPSDDRSFLKVESGGRRTGHPLQPGSAPGIVLRDLAVTHGPQEIHHGQNISDGQDGRARGGEHVQHLELRRILPIAPRHSHVAQEELRKKREIEAEEDDQRRQTAP